MTTHLFIAYLGEVPDHDPSVCTTAGHDGLIARTPTHLQRHQGMTITGREVLLLMHYLNTVLTIAGTDSKDMHVMLSSAGLTAG